MAGADTARRPFADGAIPLVALVAVVLLVPPLNNAAYGLAALYMLFGAGQAAHGSMRPGEPRLPWRLYGSAAAIMTIVVPLTAVTDVARHLLAVPLALVAAGFYLHVHVKARHGVWRIGVLSACGRRAHDGRVGRTVEARCLILAVATLTTGPTSAALYAVAGWLLSAAAVAERDDPSASWLPEVQPRGGGPARAA
jgi:hypothetical protein